MMTTTTQPPLTKRQRWVLRHIRDTMLKRQRPPTIRELCDAAGTVSPHGTDQIILRLIRKGYLQRDRHGACGLRLVGAIVRVDYDDSDAGRRLREALEE